MVFQIVTMTAYILAESKFDDFKVVKICSDDYCFPRVVWTYWEDIGSLPDDIHEMINVSRASLENLTYCVVTTDNISDFLGTENFPKYYYMISRPANRADYIRVRLIEKYGGFWIDASTFINSGTAIEYSILLGIESKSLYISYASGKYFGTTNFFAAPMNSILMRKFREQYDEMLSLDNYRKIFKQRCKKLEMKLGLSLFGCRSYFMIDYIFTSVVVENPDFQKRMLKLTGSLTQHPFTFKDADDFRHMLNCNATAKSFPFIKVPHEVRNGKPFNIREFGKDCDQSYI